MACYHPIDAWQLESGEIKFVERGKVLRSLRLPCGQCIGCRLERSRRWAMRCLHEASLYDVNSFVTLTYDEDNCPRSLNYRDFQLFMKRLRKYFPKARFFMCGEYGELYGRPHFHVCLFGVHFSDRVVHSKRASGNTLYTSALLSKLWTVGFSSIGDVTFESAAYVARYVTKKVTGKAAEEHYTRIDRYTGELYNVEPEFAHMSLKPGIGQPWLKKFMCDVYPHDYVIVNGMKVRPPKYYDNIFREHGAVRDVSDFEFARFEKALSLEVDATPERLAVKETIAKARLDLKRRVL